MILKLGFLLLLALFFTATLQKYNCISSTPANALSAAYDLIPNFQSGAATLQNKQTPVRYNYYNITLLVHFNNSYDIAISIQNINSFIPKDGMDFFVNAIRRPTMLEVVFAIDPSIKWVNAQIYFLVSARQDFAIGIFVAGKSLVIPDSATILSAQSNGSSIRVHEHLPHKINVSSDYLYAIPFISGLRTFDQNLNCSFVSSFYNSSLGILYVDMMISYLKYPLESLYISYLIFNMESDLEITSFSNLTFTPTNVNVFIGVSRVSPTTVTVTANTSANSTASKTPLYGLGSSFETQKNFDMIFGINGIVIQTQQSLDLLFRTLAPPNSTLKTLQCVSKSKCNSLAGTMVYDQSKVYSINSRCLICMDNGFYNQTLGNCQCKRGFVQRNTTCVKISSTCTANSTFDNQTLSCKCKNLYANVSNDCLSIFQVCKSGEVYFQGKCIKIVFSSAATANCSNDSLYINRTCVKKANCTVPLILNNNSNTCECPAKQQHVGNDCVACTVNETFVEQTCQCKPGFFRISGKCLSCSPNAFFNGTTCVCFRFFTGDGFKCTKSSTEAADLAQSLAPKGTYQGGAIILN